MLKFLLTCLMLVSSILTQLTAPCPYLGEIYPPPKNFTSHPLWVDAIQNFSQTLLTEQWRLNVTSFAIQVVSQDSKEPIYEKYHKAPGHLYGLNGKKDVDADTIFRIGSISKMFTIYGLLLQCGFKCFEDPITKYVPELQGATFNNYVDDVRWDEVTVGALAAQSSGIGRDYALGDISLSGVPPATVGLPPLPPNESSIRCGGVIGQLGCNRQQTFQLLFQHRPVFPAWYTPAYSNSAYQLIGYAIEALAGKSYEKIMKSLIFGPLGMTRSSVFAPSLAEGLLIPNDNTFNWSIGDAAPAGNIYMSSTDVSKHIHAMLDYQQLPISTTRRWLKPVAHTADLLSSVGAPWEIARYPGFSTYHTIDIYRKNGAIGAYSAMYGLMPDFNVGYNILVAGDGFVTADQLEAAILLVLIPALYGIAKEQAVTNFAGTYSAKGINSSLTLAADAEIGLAMQSWISNGTDMRTVMASLGLTWPPRIYPTGLGMSRCDGQGQRVAFRFPLPYPGGVCGAWGGVDALRYAIQPLDELVFETGSNGVAVSVVIPGFRVKMKKQ